MSRIILLAPGVIPPWTEGRKIFVTDLVADLRSRGLDVDLLDGTPATSSGGMILDSLLRLRAICRGKEADTVVVFPYGTFHGFRGSINTWLLRRSRAICAKAGVTHIPVFYSCVGLEMDQLGHRFGPALTVGRSGPNVAAMHLGIRHPSRTWQPTGNGLQRVLFLCGYQKPTSRALHDVLYERGLVDLLDAGNHMAAANIRLTVAVPFLRDARMCERMRKEIARRCPALDVELQGEVDPYALFQGHDAFAFPYRSEHSVFVPTSLLEAMSFGIPVLAADHAMYRDLTTVDSRARCGLYRVGDSEDLARTLYTMRGAYDEEVRKACVVSGEVRKEWTVERAVVELLAAISSMAK